MSRKICERSEPRVRRAERSEPVAQRRLRRPVRRYSRLLRLISSVKRQILGRYARRTHHSSEWLATLAGERDMLL